MGIYIIDSALVYIRADALTAEILRRTILKNNFFRTAWNNWWLVNKGELRDKSSNALMDSDCASILI